MNGVDQNQDNHGVNCSACSAYDKLNPEFYHPSFPNPSQRAEIVYLGLNVCLSEHMCLMATRIKIIPSSKSEHVTGRESMCNAGSSVLLLPTG